MTRGRGDLSFLEDEYPDKLAFILGLKLSSQCKTETHVWFMNNIFESCGIFVVFKWGPAHPEFFVALDEEIIQKILHSTVTKIPSILSLKTFVNVIRTFWRVNPNDLLRVLVIGTG